MIVLRHSLVFTISFGLNRSFDFILGAVLFPYFVPPLLSLLYLFCDLLFFFISLTELPVNEDKYGRDECNGKHCTASGDDIYGVVSYRMEYIININFKCCTYLQLSPEIGR